VADQFNHFLETPMTAKRGRSRTTNKPPSNRPGRSPKALSRRVTDLYRAYLERLGPGPHDPIIEANALRWAELTVICETLRAKALAGEDIDANDITRLESTAARVERAMVKGAEDNKRDLVAESWLASQEQFEQGDSE
jgi:hypothetical protein